MNQFIDYFEDITKDLTPTDPNTIPPELVQNIGIYVKKKKGEGK